MVGSSRNHQRGAPRPGTGPTNVLVAASDDYRVELRDLLRSNEQATYRFVDSDRSLARELRRAEVVFLWPAYASKFRELWSSARSVRWIHLASVGVDVMLVIRDVSPGATRTTFDELIESDVVLTNCRGVLDRSIAEYVLGLVIAMAKDFVGTLEAQRAHVWRHRAVEDLEGRRVVVIGAGSIGRAIGRAASAVGLDVRVVARSARSDPELGEITAIHDLPRLLPSTDFLVIAAPLTPETHRLINDRMINRLPRTARLINVGRGPIVDQAAVVTALRRGRLAGAALDVFESEPLAIDDPIWSVPNLIVSPHMSADTGAWVRRYVDCFNENLRRWLSQEALINVVDKRLGFVVGVEAPDRPGAAASG